MRIYRPTSEPLSSVTQSAEHIIQQNSSDWIWQEVFPEGNKVYFTAPDCGGGRGELGMIKQLLGAALASGQWSLTAARSETRCTAKHLKME